MKTAYITHLYPPEHIGGTENYTHALARGLLSLGHQVQVLCVGEWERGDHYWNGHSDDLLDGVPVRRLHLNWTKAPDVNRNLYDNAFVGDYVTEYLNQTKPDLVHVTSCNTLSASVVGAAKQAGLPVVITLTDYWFLCPRVTLVTGDGALCDGRVAESECVRCLLHGSKASRWLTQLLPDNVAARLFRRVSRQRWLTQHRGLRGMAMDIHDRRATLHRALHQAERVLIASESARTLFHRNGFSMPIEVVPYGHDLSRLSRYRGKRARDAVTFGFIGQISPLKGPQLLIDAFKRVSQNVRARLLIYGDMQKNAEFAQRLRSMASGRENIRFRGTFPHAESGGVFSEIDVLVVPSVWNDFPLVINEAFATETPVIATALDGLRELVQHEVNGLLFERGSAADLARTLERVVVEPGLLAHLRRGMPTVKSLEAAVEEMVEIYRETMSRTRLSSGIG